ncbi:MAG TPA: HAD family acid phosphatase [Bryobacteraceae bacterium]|nr:HAD family acid phosphatase [Bryobacteraceae bacterium]
MNPRFLLCLLMAGFAAAQPHENLNAVNWMQTAAEYRASALQTYRAAEASMLRALHDKTWTAAIEQRRPVADLPVAVILDLDETVLDNSVHQARLAAAGAAFDDPGWQKWVAEKRAGLIPGAREFLLAAHAHGVAAFYVTNRVCDPNKAEDPTVAVLRLHHLPFRPERLLCKTDTSDKSARRALVAAGNRIVLLIGDDFNDFVSLTREQANVEDRFAAVDAYHRYWGERWFMLPNPTYGSWERAVGAGVDAKRKALRQ